MSKLNRRTIVVGPKTWDKLKDLGKKEERSLSELVREALFDLFAKRERPKSVSYDPINDRFSK